MHDRIAGSKLVRYDVASHNIGDQYAERCTDDLLRFLEENAGPGLVKGRLKA